MHQDALALDPRRDIRMGEQRLDEAAARGSVLGELRLVEIEADDDAALRRVDQRLDDLRVRQDVRRHVDGQFGAADLPSVNAFKVFARRVVDLAWAPLRPRVPCPAQAAPSAINATQALRNKRIAKADFERLKQMQPYSCIRLQAQGSCAC